MTRHRVFVVLAVAVLAGACSAGGGAQTASPTSAPSPTIGPTQGGAGVQVNVASSSFGNHLTGANGRALYLLTTDSANTSTCSGDCAGNWPPLVVSAPTELTAGAGVTGTLGTFTRGDTNQATINGLPLYYFAGDSAAGHVNGQGLAGVWYLAATDGSMLGAEAVNTPVPCACTMPANETDDGYDDPYGDDY